MNIDVVFGIFILVFLDYGHIVRYLDRVRHYGRIFRKIKTTNTLRYINNMIGTTVRNWDLIFRLAVVQF
jgi:hypothetical protein